MQSNIERLFSENLIERQWVEFLAKNYKEPVCGVVYSSANPPLCGMPLGGIGTGCIDLETDGTFGLSSIFNCLASPRTGDHSPFLGIRTNEGTLVLTTHSSDRLLQGNVQCAKKIRYWGHYPIADLEYESDFPLSVGLRAWAPFIPGDEKASNTPGAVFEVNIRNMKCETVNATVAFSFPGPSLYERQHSNPYTKYGKTIYGQFTGIGVLDSYKPEEHGFDDNWIKKEYAIGVIDAKNEKVRIGGGIEADGRIWGEIGSSLPDIPHPRTDRRESAASVAVDFAIDPGETKVIKFVLAWYVYKWNGNGSPLVENHVNHSENFLMYKNMYAERFNNALEIAEYLAENHERLLQKIILWQQSVYSYPGYPAWLKDSLINILHLITKDSRWAAPAGSIGEWAGPEGVFAMSESPRQNPQMECIACTWYSHYPVLFFFPKLAVSTIRTIKHFALANGCPPFHLGELFDIAKPSLYDYQSEQNGTVYVDLVRRLWKYTGDDNILREFYESVKKATEYQVSENKGDFGILACTGANFFEIYWPGIITYVAGMRLAGISMGKDMAEKIGDMEFAARCSELLDKGKDMLESMLWNGQYYDLFVTTKEMIDTMKRKTNIPDFLKAFGVTFTPDDISNLLRCDFIFANQLDGEWMARIHGLEHVFLEDRIKKTLNSLKETSVSYSETGIINVLHDDGTTVDDMYRAGSFFPTEAFMLAMTYMFNDDIESGMEIVRKTMENIVIKQGYAWEFPNSINSKTGIVDYGNDYSQGLMLWALPLAIQGVSIGNALSGESLIKKILEASI